MSKIRKFNSFLFFKLPAAWWTGVRLRALDSEQGIVTVRHRWINQNPFKSMFWAVQGMAAELSTGTIVIEQIKASGKRISMLVVSNQSVFTKKARGKITFHCKDGNICKEALEKTISTGEGISFWMTSVGKDEQGDEVATFKFEWSVKLKSDSK